MKYVNINGRFFPETEAGIPYDSRGFRYGFGIFETMLIINGEIQLKAYHWDRLFTSLKQLKFVVPDLMNEEWLEEEVIKTVKKNKLDRLSRVRLQMYGGRGGLFEGQYPWSEFVIECHAITGDTPQLNEKGYRIGIAQGYAKAYDSIANMKTSNAMIYALAAMQATERGLDGILLKNTSGNLIEGSYANIFCVKGDTVCTPPLSEGCVSGVMRRHIMSELLKKGMHVKEVPFTAAFLKDADSCFISNAVRRIKWISSIEDMEYTIDKVLPIYEAVSY